MSKSQGEFHSPKKLCRALHSVRAVASCGDMQQLSCVWLCRVQRPIMRRAMCLLNHVTSQSNHHTSHNHSQHSTAQHTDFLDDARSEINNFSRHRCVKRRGLAVLCKVPWERMSWHYYTRSCPVSRRAM